MTIGQAQGINPYISNISWYAGKVPQITQPQQQRSDVITGNPNRPAVLNFDPNAGPLVTRDWLA